MLHREHCVRLGAVGRTECRKITVRSAGPA